MRDDKVITFVAIELLIVALALLLFVFVLIFNVYSPKVTTNAITVINLDSHSYIKNTCKIVKVPYKVKVPYEGSHWERRSYSDYDSSAYQKRVVGYLGNNIDEYVVVVDNYRHRDDYIEVKFLFKDYSGREHSYLAGKYSESGEDVKFVYRDIYADKDKHYEFSYEIIGDRKTYRKEVIDINYRWETGYRLEKVC